ncbi:MAG TPA: hypothetical protein VGF45_11390, partial [Polyangia bacterium]
CLAERGLDGDDRAWPLFSNAFAGGHHPFTLLGFNVLWTRVFGTGVAAFRAASAVWVVLSCLGLFAFATTLARLLKGRGGEGAVRVFAPLVLLAALVSPWSFQFSRVAWEGPIAPAFLVLALAALARFRASGRLIWSIVAGLCAGLSMISYPPLRPAVPPILLLAVWLLARGLEAGERRRLGLKLLVGAGLWFLVLLPVVFLTLSGEITTRTKEVAIFNPEWLDKHRGLAPRWVFFLSTFFDNLVSHLRPSYLFFSGDVNGRHSSQLVGQLSPVDTLAIAFAAFGVGWLLRVAYRALRTRPAADDQPVRSSEGTGQWPGLADGHLALVAVAGFAVLAGAFATAPAALTHDSLPHALRSIGTWPFVALFSGSVLALAWSRFRWAPPITALIAIIYTGMFLPQYAKIYDRLDPWTFHRPHRDAVEAAKAQQPPGTARAALAPHASPDKEDLRYYVMHYDGLSCAESRDYIQGKLK